MKQEPKHGVIRNSGGATGYTGAYSAIIVFNLAIPGVSVYTYL
jgi:alpha-beta hydrolase superfamily lysophospholipase